MKPGLQFRLHQQLALTPQLQQAIRLLQLSNLELETELRQLTEANPMRTLDDLDDEPDATALEKPDPDASAAASDDEVELHDGNAEFIDTPLEFNSSHSRAASADGFQSDDIGSSEETLREHLLWQLNLANMDVREQAIAGVLIDAI
ncbi:MAG: RNA polymerase factor sigma-54, partial [Xanthomonadales bacterium]|nr:RNA polymerase factor sigma-54 [Xanthomonadales bacterium]